MGIQSLKSQLASTMKIAVLGASGRTGQEFLQVALNAKHQVVAIVRTPEKIQIQHDNLEVVVGDIYSDEDLKKHFSGVDAVVSCLGFLRSSAGVTGYTDTIKQIVSAMRSAYVKRLVVMTAYYSDISSAENQGFLVRWFLIPFLRPVLVNMREMELYLESECLDIDYTIVRPPGLATGPSSDKEVQVEFDQFFLKNASGMSRMPRADVARYMLDCIPRSEECQRAVAIGV